MRLWFEMSGEWGGSSFDALATEVDSKALPDGERRALHETVDAVRAGDDAGLDEEARAQGTIYRLRVDDGTVTEVVYDDRTLPVDLLPLIELLRDRAIDERIERNRNET